MGCVDPDASNYDSDAQIDDEPTTCVYKDAVVWLDCDHNPSWDLVDWSQTDCVGTISGSRCDVSCVHGYTAERPLCYNNSWVDNGGCLPNPCDSDPTILNLNTTSSECEGTLSNATCDFECTSGYTAFGTWCSSVVFERGIRAWYSSAKCENVSFLIHLLRGLTRVSFLIHLLRGLTRVTYTTNNLVTPLYPSLAIISIERFHFF